MVESVAALLSYDHGASAIKLRAQTIGAALVETAARMPDGQALVVRGQDVRWTCHEVARRADDFAAGLLSLPLQAGDRVGMCSPTARNGWSPCLRRRRPAWSA